jgi:hypothetical protein
VTASLITSRWFELLDVYVAFNTIVFGKLWPRRRR